MKKQKKEQESMCIYEVENSYYDTFLYQVVFWHFKNNTLHQPKEWEGSHPITNS